MRLRRWVSVAAAAVVVFAAGSCASDVKRDAACADASDAVVGLLSQALTKGGNIRFASVLPSPDADHVFVSFENRTADQVKSDRSGHILTVVAPSAASTSFEAVDERARHETKFPEADIDVRANGAVTSRACVLGARQAN